MELMMTIGIAAIVMFGVAIMLADNLHAWRTMYSRLHSVEAENVYAVRRVFDRTIRQAVVTGSVVISPLGNSLEADYYDCRSLPALKCHASFIYGNNTLTVICTKNKGTTEIERWQIQNVANNLPIFNSSGRSIQMLLTLNNVSSDPQVPFSETLNVFSTAYLNNW